MYTWGYVKEACLAKLDMTNDEATRIGLFNKFPFYANEAMTQICSSLKAKATYATFNVHSRDEYFSYLRRKYNISNIDFDFTFLWNISEYNAEDLPIAPINMQDMWHEFHDENVVFVNEMITMPEDFVNFGNDVNHVIRKIYEYNCARNQIMDIATDEEWNTIGYNQVIFFVEGTFLISYDARWFTFTSTIDDKQRLDIPADIVDSLPSYIVSQCYKIDDESKANSYRVEFETFLARIEENRARTNKTIHLKGGW